jgi:ABC-type multidrug transport system fused ATPase/permease subunit
VRLFRVGWRRKARGLSSSVRLVSWGAFQIVGNVAVTALLDWPVRAATFVIPVVVVLLFSTMGAMLRGRKRVRQVAMFQARARHAEILASNPTIRELAASSSMLDQDVAAGMYHEAAQERAMARAYRAAYNAATVGKPT